MINHVNLIVNNFEVSKKWYELALAPIGYAKLLDLTKEKTGSSKVAAFGESATNIPDFSISSAGSENSTSPAHHIAFNAASHKEVDEFYHAAIKAGGKDNGKPGIRKEYHPDYYAAFVFDPDGYNIEAVCQTPND